MEQMDLFEGLNFDDIELEENNTEENVCVCELEDNEDFENLLNDISNNDSEVKQQEQTKTTTTKKSKKKATQNVEQPKEEEYTGIRRIIVYGQELFTVEDPKVTMDDIRKRIVDEFNYPEFSADRTYMSLDKETGIVVPVIRFEKKG